MIRKPSPGTILGLIALVVAMTGTAFAATGQLVNIADGTNANRIAHVNSSGYLQTQVNGSITSREAIPADLYRNVETSDNACVPIATPPAGQALVIKTVNIDVFTVGSPPSYVKLSVGASCVGGTVTDVDFETKGLITVPLDPGITVPAGQKLWADPTYPTGVTVSTMGYRVPAGSVP